MASRPRQRNSLIAEAAACRACPRMDGSRRVLSSNNGPWDARIMFVGEAPGRRGAERTGIPFCGDVSGQRFEELLAIMGYTREQVFITNAVLCNPRDQHGRNAPPTRREIHNCGDFLRRTIDVVDPRVVVALGAVALRALTATCSHSLVLSSDAGGLVPWYGRRLGVLYHPGQRSIMHRPWAWQQRDAKRLARAIARLSGCG